MVMTVWSVTFASMTQPPDKPSHDDPDYTRRLEDTRAWWKRLLGAQRPYRRNIRRVVEGRVLDIGCGVGRNLVHLDGRGVGVDSNRHSVEVARSRGLTVHHVDVFGASQDAVPGGYGTLLFAHVLEHMTNSEASALVGRYLGYLQPGGRVVFIVPQEAGFRSDVTHVDPVDADVIEGLAKDHGLRIERLYSFPLPGLFGRVFRHNETVALLRGLPGPGPTTTNL